MPLFFDGEAHLNDEISHRSKATGACSDEVARAAPKLLGTMETAGQRLSRLRVLAKEELDALNRGNGDS